MRRIFELLSENRVVVLAMFLFVVVAALVYLHTSPAPISPPSRKNYTLPQEDCMEPVTYPISHHQWGRDPFISPFIEERLKVLKRLEEERVRKEREEERRRREEEERKRREEEERKRRDEEQKRKQREEQVEKEKSHLAELARKIRISGIMTLHGGSVQVFLNGRACVVGSSVWQDGERFRVVKVTEDFVILEDRLGQKHRLEIER